MPRTSTLLLELAAGERHDLLCERGSRIVLLSGSSSLHYGLLNLVGHSFRPPSQTLLSEQSLELQSGGWITLEASRASQLLLLPPAAGWCSQAYEKLRHWLGDSLPSPPLPDSGQPEA